MSKKQVEAIKTKINYSTIDPEVVKVVKAINDLPFVATRFSCAGFGAGEDYKGKHNHEECGAAYLALKYSNSKEQKRFHKALMDLGVFDEVAYWKGKKNCVGYYIFYRGKRCNGACWLKKGTQAKLAGKWSKVLKLVKGWAL